MSNDQPTGFQLAFLSFALLLLVVPLTYFVQSFVAPSATRELIGRFMPFVAAALGMAAVPAVRRACRRDLAIPVPRDRYREVAIVCVLVVGHGFAWAGAYVLWWDFREGAVALEQRLREFGTHDANLAKSLTFEGLMLHFVLGSVVAPILEELVFRGFLYRAWERRYNWVVAMLLSSALFAAYHPNFLLSFMSAVLFVGLYRRTGSLRAPILAHMLSNMLVHYALLGQFVFPRDLPAPGDLASWKFQLACLLVMAIALPAYVWMSRERNARHLTALDAHAALPR